VALVAILQAAMAADIILTNGLLTSTLTPAGGKITISESNGNTTKTFVLQTKLMTEMAKSSTSLFPLSTHNHPSPVFGCWLQLNF
jgi:hypothetical protein